MELSSEEAATEIPMPLTSVYAHAHAHMTHHHHHHHQQEEEEDLPSSTPSHNNNNINIIIPSVPSNNLNGSITPALNLEDQQNHHHQQVPFKLYNGNKKKLVIKYRECQKNHAACMGGKATDGCGEFMPNGEEGTLEALICSVCTCHRNFHRKEIDHGHHHHDHTYHQYPHANSHHIYLPTTHPHPHHMISSTTTARGRNVISKAMPFNVGPKMDEYDDHGMMMMMRPSTHDDHQMVKRRFRTKFSQEQKEKMLEFAEKVGWKIQRQEEDVVQQFCQQLGIKRRVLKVWMHNNKHTFAKKMNNNPSTTPTTTTTTTNTSLLN